MTASRNESIEMENFSATQSPSVSADESARPNNDDDNQSIASVESADLGDLVLCCICSTNLPVSARITTTQCRCTWCRDCLNRCFRHGYASRTAFPPVCCPLNRRMDPAQVQGCLDDAVVARITLVHDEYSTPNPVYCANLACRLFLPEDNNNQRTLVCRHCGATTCRACKARHGEDGACVAAGALGEENRALLVRLGWKACPACTTLVERTGGCRFVRCPCGIKLCYACGEALRGWTRWGVPLCGCGEASSVGVGARDICTVRFWGAVLYALILALVVSLMIGFMTLMVHIFQKL